ncbi:MAG: GNAT family N-acetyltransferase [Planctomycetes bacterium]|nr:GNAT family N-acetyltransferase [Planctomycetota bacterium]
MMSDLFDKQRQPETTLPATNGPVVVPIDDAVSQHLSQVYWDWRVAFDRDPQSNPLQHPDYVLTELATSRVPARLNPVLVREESQPGQFTVGILVPKSVRTNQVGGIGPGWTLQGLRLAGGRFLATNSSPAQVERLLKRATQHVAESNADFLLIEDLDQSTTLYAAVQNGELHGCQRFATHEFQPRRYVDFPASEAEYWSTFSSRSLSKFRRNLKKFGRTRLECVTELEQIPDFLQSAHEISRQSWQSRQYGLRIRNDDAELRQLSVLAQHGMLRSYLWWIDDKPAAFAVCNQHAGCFRYEEIAYCSEFGQFSPGRTMLQQIVEDLLRHDSPKILDFGGGDAEYKQQFANRSSTSGTIWLVPPAWRARCSLSYLKSCRQLRSVCRRLIKKSGLGTSARQWIRAGGAAHPADSIPITNDVAQATSNPNP